MVIFCDVIIYALQLKFTRIAFKMYTNMRMDFDRRSDAAGGIFAVDLQYYSCCYNLKRIYMFNFVQNNYC